MLPRRHTEQLFISLMRRAAGVDRRGVKGVIESTTGAVKFIGRKGRPVTGHVCCPLERQREFIASLKLGQESFNKRQVKQ